MQKYKYLCCSPFFWLRFYAWSDDYEQILFTVWMFIFDMSNYNLIREQFRNQGYDERSELTEYELNRVLDKMSQANYNRMEFDRSVSQELYEQTPKARDGRVAVKDFINTILLAHEALKNHIDYHSEKARQLPPSQEKAEFIEATQQFEQDYALLTRSFNINAPQVRGFDQRGDMVGAGLGNNSQFIHNPTQIQESSNALWFVLMITLVALFFEIICMFVRHHFTGSLCYLAVISIFLLNYFDRKYIRICLILLAISILLDLIWIFSLADIYWSAYLPPTHHYTQRPFFMKVVWIFSLFLAFAKAIITFFLFAYRDNDQSTQALVKFFDLRFELNARPALNPISKFFRE